MLLEVFGHLFVSISGTFNYLIYFDNTKATIYGLLISQWSDAGGFMFGSWFGKTPFANSISPTKTWEGVAGAVLLPTTAITFLFWFLGQYTEGYMAMQMSLARYMTISLSISVLAVTGDLIESFIKRCANKKDAGTIL